MLQHHESARCWQDRHIGTLFCTNTYSLISISSPPVLEGLTKTVVERSTDVIQDEIQDEQERWLLIYMWEIKFFASQSSAVFVGLRMIDRQNDLIACSAQTESLLGMRV